MATVVQRALRGRTFGSKLPCRVAADRPPLFQQDAGCRRSYHVAVLGSGPAGFYTAKYLFKLAGTGDMRVDMIERLPTPFGLVRFGVAPDHPEVKNVINDFTDVAGSPQFRFFGNVEVGASLTLDKLRSLYDAVVVCTGAQGERTLGIKGEDIKGVVGAPDFVKWYNGHPEHRIMDCPAPGEAAAVIGQGNVALDVARLLVRPVKDLQPTDMDADSLARIADWHRQGLQTVHVIGRRGFVQAAFANAELRELLKCGDEVLPIVDPAELARCRNPASEQELAKSRVKKRSVEILEKMAANFAERKTTSKRIIWLRFLQSPAEFLGGPDGALSGVRLMQTELQGEAGAQRAVIPDGAISEDVKCGLVVRSVGFDLTPLDTLPLDKHHRVPHQRGVVEAGHVGKAGLFVSGWAKRGPQGIIGSNLTDAQETAKSIMADLASGVDAGGKNPDSKGLQEALQQATVGEPRRTVTFSDWQLLEAEERRRGLANNRSAEKMTDVGEMLRLLERAHA
eukprot:TRINITY_DN61558_c0_g1_i1.p1 TRINITY_DN61558_c0_g1~~TRINITY_DN61558_c0_g1_i1.p1  ORF type:complete len:509 (+),score=82.35 TRINITY_DN61558_c0_g1_i1:71-1597(+)